MNASPAPPPPPHQDAGARSGDGAKSVERYLVAKNEADGVAVEWNAAIDEMRMAMDALSRTVRVFRSGGVTLADVNNAEAVLDHACAHVQRLLGELKTTLG